MGFVAPLIAGLTGLGGLFGNRGQQVQQNQNLNQTGSQTGTTTPNLDPRASGLYDQLLNHYQSLLGNQDLSGYQAGAIGDINQTSDIKRKAMEQMLAARGIQGPAAANTLGNVENQRFSNITQLNQQLPLLQSQLSQQALTSGQGLFGAMPYGSSQQQNTTNEQRAVNTTKNPGNMLGGLFSSLGPILAQLYGSGGD